MNKKFIDQLKKDVGRITYESILDETVKNIKSNVKFLKFGKNISKIRNAKFAKNKVALIIGSGPSLREKNQIIEIQKNRNKFIIIAADGALYYLLQNKIIPDLVVSLDPHPTRIVRWFGDDTLNRKNLHKDDYFRKQDLDINFRKELKVNKEILNLTKNYGNKLKIALCTSSSKKVVKRLIKIKSNIYWWNPFLDDPDKKKSITRKMYFLNKLPIINTGGNVGSACWMMADSVFNCKKIVLIGMDFGYYLSTKFKNTQYHKVLIKTFGSKKINSFYKKIYNPFLKKTFYTDYVYIWYKTCLFEMIKYSKNKTFNCTEGGILFGKNLKNMRLIDFCKNYL